MLTLAEEGKASIWDGQDILDQIDLIDEDIKMRLGTERLKLKPKAYAFYDGILVVGFEQNTIIKYNIEDNTKEIVIAGPS
jgi:hypothetical protein